MKNSAPWSGMQPLVRVLKWCTPLQPFPVLLFPVRFATVHLIIITAPSFVAPAVMPGTSVPVARSPNEGKYSATEKWTPPLGERS